MSEDLLPIGSNSTWNEVDNATGKVLNVIVCSVTVCGRSGEWRKKGHPANSTYIQTPFNGGYWGQYYTNGVWKTSDGGIIQPVSNQIISSTGTYTPPVPAYNTRPIISSVSVSSITSNSAIISWVTDVPATGFVNYGTPIIGIVTPENTSLTTQHSFTLSNLAANSLYNYRVYSHNAYGDQTDLVNGLPPNRTFTTLNGSASCSGINLTLNDGKTTYIKGVDKFVNYTWTCTPSGSTDVNIGIQKPVYGWISLNTTANSSTKTLSIDISGDGYPIGAYRLEACFNTCGSIVAGTTFSIATSTPTPTPTPTPTVSNIDFAVTNVTVSPSSVVAGNSIAVSATFYNPSNITKSIQVTIGKGVSTVSDGSQMSVTYYLSLPPGYTTQTQNFTASYGATSSAPGSPANTYYPEASISGVGNGSIYIDPYDPNTGNNYLRATLAYMVTSTPTPTPTPATATGSTSFDNFSRDLYLGSRGNDVTRLQALLVNEVSYPANLITGYFGSITQNAVKKLQEKYGIRPVSGYFGEITRQKLQALFSAL